MVAYSDMGVSKYIFFVLYRKTENPLIKRMKSLVEDKNTDIVACLLRYQ